MSAQPFTRPTSATTARSATPETPAPDGLEFVPALVGRRAYDPGPPPVSVRLQLDRNEGPPPPLAAQVALATLDPEMMRRYPSPAPVERRVAIRDGLDADRVLLCNGGDEGIDRCCRLMLAPGRRAVVHTPTFEMIERSAELAGGQVTHVPWGDGPFPREAMIAAAEGGLPVHLVAIVSPNNPTGLVASVADALAIADAVPRALVLVDAAYVEFHDDAFVTALLEADRPNLVVVRTFSKAWGLAGLRCGWVAGPARLIAGLRAAGGPYAVGGGTLATIGMLLDSGLEPDPDYLARVDRERRILADLLRRTGGSVPTSRANFVSVTFEDPAEAERIVAGLAAEGIAVRRFGGSHAGMLRITCPGDLAEFASLIGCLGPLLDIDVPDELVETPFEAPDAPMRDEAACDGSSLLGRTAGTPRRPRPAGPDALGRSPRESDG